MIECAILLEARHPSQNIMRSYFISAWYDLFDRLMIEIIHGRIGARGKSSMFYMNNPEEAIEFITSVLKNGKPLLSALAYLIF